MYHYYLTSLILDLIYRKFEILGLIHCFEYTFELALRTIKDYLENEGFEVNSPREVIQTAFQIELITDGHVWLDALNKRNFMAHTYDEITVNEAEELIRHKYYLATQEFLEKLENI